MKRLLTSFLALAFLLCMGNVSFASQVTKTLIDGVTLNDVTTTATGTDYLGDADNVAFFVSYDETDATAALSVAVTLQISCDGTNWLTAYFYDYAGGITAQTSETLSTDSWYYFAPGIGIGMFSTTPYARVTLTPTGHDATHTALVSVYIIKKQ